MVIWGRRRVGKTRLLLEWLEQFSLKHARNSQNIQNALEKSGLYWVADESSASLQRRYFAMALAQYLPSFDEIEYPDWQVFFNRLAKEAKTQASIQEN
ncbi:MAG: hypothetical protein ACKOAD_03905 [Gammaproteobacteria bacterium]